MRQFVMENGLRVYLDPFDYAAVGMTFIVHGGHRTDPADRPGSSHMLEHLLLDETTNIKDVIEYSEEFADEFNAWTDESSIAIYCNVVRFRARDAIRMIADVVLHPTLTAAHLRRELHLLQEEYGDIEEDRDSVIEQELDQFMFGRGGWGKAVDEAHLTEQHYRARDLFFLHRRLFVGNNAAFIVVGGFDPEKMEKEIRTCFAPLPTGRETKIPTLNYLSLRRHIHLKPDEGKRIFFRIGFPTFGAKDPDRIALGVLRNHLVNRARSRLGKRLVRDGHCYSLRNSLHFWRDVGQLAIYAQISPSKFPEALRIIAEELTGLKKTLISRDDLDRAKRNLKNYAYLQSRRPHDSSTFFARQWVNQDDIMPLRPYRRAVDEVSRHGIRKVARRIFVQKRLVLSVHGPIHKRDRANIETALRFR